jgi:hypothetical protein
VEVVRSVDSASGGSRSMIGEGQAADCLMGDSLFQSIIYARESSHLPRAAGRASDAPACVSVG